MNDIAIEKKKHLGNIFRAFRTMFTSHVQAMCCDVRPPGVRAPFKSRIEFHISIVCFKWRNRRRRKKKGQTQNVRRIVRRRYKFQTANGLTQRRHDSYPENGELCIKHDRFDQTPLFLCWKCAIRCFRLRSFVVVILDENVFSCDARRHFLRLYLRASVYAQRTDECNGITVTYGLVLGAMCERTRNGIPPSHKQCAHTRFSSIFVLDILVDISVFSICQRRCHCRRRLRRFPSTPFVIAREHTCRLKIKEEKLISRKFRVFIATSRQPRHRTTLYDVVSEAGCCYPHLGISCSWCAHTDFVF